MISRRALVAGGAVLVAGCAGGVGPGHSGAGDRFVTVEGLHFMRDGRPYRYADGEKGRERTLTPDIQISSRGTTPCSISSSTANASC